MAYEKLREELEAKHGVKKADKIIKKLEKSYADGKRDDQLKKVYTDALSAEGISDFDGPISTTVP